MKSSKQPNYTQQSKLQAIDRLNFMDHFKIVVYNLVQFVYNIFYFMGCQSSQTLEYIQQNPRTGISLGNLPQITHYSFEQALKLGNEFFQKGELVEAIRVYQKMIENDYSIDFDISGVGNAELMISRYEWFVYRWFDQQRVAGKIKDNAYDALSLCYCIIRNSNEAEAERGILWYEDMISERNGYELQVGYGNLLYNRSRYEESIKAYNKVIQMKPELINIYVGIALTYQYRRIEKPKSIAMANTILQKNEENMYAHFILARNTKDIDQKIEKLKVASLRFPEYVRITNEIGICYGGTKKMYEQAIKWYTRCTQITPQYASCYNNIGVNHQLMKHYQQAMTWYFKACQYDHQYKTAHVNVSDIFDTLQYNDDKIDEEMKKYPKLDRFTFYYYLGLAYYDKKQYDNSTKWYNKAELLDSKNYKLMNSFGIVYDQLRDFQNGAKYYLKCIQYNPKYHSAYYNLAILYKNQDNIDKAVEWYKKAIEANPRYSYAYNNLGNIYKNKQEYQKAIDCYQNAVQNLSTYTLAYANMGICLLQLNKFQQAFNSFARAKQCLPTDNNNLSQSNKAFLKENMDKFDKEGEKWRKTGSINPEQAQILKNLIKSFESNFNKLYSGLSLGQVSDSKALRPQMLQIVTLIHEDRFQLKNIDTLFNLIRHIFSDDEEYFHIIPQVFIQYFWNKTFKQKQAILQIEDNLSSMIKAISEKESGTSEGPPQIYNLDIKLKNFNPTNDYTCNLFKNTMYFDNYQILYSQIDKVNKQAEKSLPEFIDFVDAVRKRSNGIPYGVSMKFPKKAEQQFKVILRILEKMFKKEITQERVQSIISKIDKQIKSQGNAITLLNIVHEIMDVWTKEITLILQNRSKSQVETTCSISDLVRGKIMFNSVEDLGTAIEACDRLCLQRGYEIVQLDNRLSKKQTTDVVLKIKIKEAICEFQLAMRKDESQYHLIHSIYEIERSPLGCIFGSYLFMSKGFAYPILANCKDIEDKLKTSAKEDHKKAVAAARYIIDALEEKAK